MFVEEDGTRIGMWRNVEGIEGLELGINLVFGGWEMWLGAV